MDLETFTKLVLEMRQAQRKYFDMRRKRSAFTQDEQYAVLDAAKILEGKVDIAIEDLRRSRTEIA